MKTMLSDMRPSGILHRIQLATHAKSLCQTNVICDVLLLMCHAIRPNGKLFGPQSCLPCRLTKAGHLGDLPADICSLPPWAVTRARFQPCVTTGQRNLL